MNLETMEVRFLRKHNRTSTGYLVLNRAIYDLIRGINYKVVGINEPRLLNGISYKSKR